MMSDGDGRVRPQALRGQHCAGKLNSSCTEKTAWSVAGGGFSRADRKSSISTAQPARSSSAVPAMREPASLRNSGR
jgi:hypothetical protein